MLSLKLLILKTPLLVPLLFATSCADAFNWEPRPYVGDSATQSLINAESHSIRCDEPRFDQMTCFDPQNIAELRSAIGQVKGVDNKKEAKKAMKIIDEAVWSAKQKRD